MIYYKYDNWILNIHILLKYKDKNIIAIFLLHFWY